MSQTSTACTNCPMGKNDASFSFPETNHPQEGESTSTWCQRKPSTGLKTLLHSVRISSFLANSDIQGLSVWEHVTDLDWPSAAICRTNTHSDPAYTQPDTFVGGTLLDVFCAWPESFLKGELSSSPSILRHRWRFDRVFQWLWYFWVNNICYANSLLRCYTTTTMVSSHDLTHLKAIHRVIGS